MRSFRRLGDRPGQGAVSLVRGNRAYGRGRLREAVAWWRRARDLLGEGGPALELTLAHLSLEAYQRGDLRAGASTAEEAAALARHRSNHEAEAVAEIYRAMFALYSGAFALGEEALARSDAALERFPAGSQQVERPLVFAGRGVLYSLREAHYAADECFAQALRLAQANGIPWFEAVTRALRAEFLASLDPARSLDDGKRGTAFFSSTGEEWWWCWAVRAQAIAARHTMNLDTSEDLLRRVLARDQNDLERGRTLLELGATLLAAGDRSSAADRLEAARRLLEPSGANFWLARVLVTQAQMDPARGAELRRRAFALAPEADPAWIALLSSGSLEVHVLGEPSVAVNGRRIGFRSRHAELIVYLLALAGARGLDAEALAERLWPGRGSERSAQRLRSVIWEARRALGSEGWRLTRRTGRWVLEPTGVRVDLAEDRERASAALATGDAELAREALGALSRPLLPAWTYEDWVRDEARDVQRLTDALRSLARRTP